MPRLVPVDENPFSSWPPQQQSAWDHLPTPVVDRVLDRLPDYLGEKASGMANGLLGALTLPGDVYAGRAQMSDPAAQDRALSLATLVGMPGEAKPGALRTGGVFSSIAEKATDADAWLANMQKEFDAIHDDVKAHQGENHFTPASPGPGINDTIANHVKGQWEGAQIPPSAEKLQQYIADEQASYKLDPGDQDFYNNLHLDKHGAPAHDAIDPGQAEGFGKMADLGPSIYDTILGEKQQLYGDLSTVSSAQIKKIADGTYKLYQENPDVQQQYNYLHKDLHGTHAYDAILPKAQGWGSTEEQAWGQSTPLSDKPAAPIPFSGPFDPSRINPNGLPLDQASRLGRARELGFDVDQPLYHGTKHVFNEFDLDRSRHGEYATFLSPDPEQANSYAGYNLAPGAQVIKAYAKMQNPLIMDWNGAYSGFDRTIAEARAAGHDSIIAHNVTDFWGDEQSNPSGRRMPGTQVMILDPANIRAHAAAFDPSRAGEADLLATGRVNLVPVDGNPFLPDGSYDESDPNHPRT